MRVLLALLLAIVGAGTGFLVGLLAGIALAPLLGISTFEGASGFFAVYLGLAIGFAGFIAGLLLPFLLPRKETRAGSSAPATPGSDNSGSRA